jgi:hypothetical protein
MQIMEGALKIVERSKSKVELEMDSRGNEGPGSQVRWEGRNMKREERRGEREQGRTLNPTKANQGDREESKKKGRKGEKRRQKRKENRKKNEKRTNRSKPCAIEKTRSILNED